MLFFRFRFVFMSVGGNNLRWNSDLNSVCTDIVSYVNRVKSECPYEECVWASGVSECI